MASPNRNTRSALTALAELGTAPHRFDFFAALRLIECAHPDVPRLGTSLRAPDDAVRLGQEPSLAFATSTLRSFGREPTAQVSRLAVRFFGLFGPNGPLPHHLTEFAIGRDLREESQRDRTLIAFCDVFHHRLLSLFYRAWSDSTPTTQFDRPDSDRFAGYVGSLFGQTSSVGAHVADLEASARRYFAGRFASLGRTAEGLRDVLGHFFGLPVQITEFVGAWLEVPRDSQSRLGDRDNMILGQTTCLGTEVWDCQHNFRVSLGPLDFDDYRRMLPDQASLARLESLVRSYVGDEFAWELQVSLRREQVPACRLDADPPASSRRSLGWTTWLAGPVERDPAPTVIRGGRRATSFTPSSA